MISNTCFLYLHLVLIRRRRTLRDGASPLLVVVMCEHMKRDGRSGSHLRSDMCQAATPNSSLVYYSGRGTPE